MNQPNLSHCRGHKLKKKKNKESNCEVRETRAEIIESDISNLTG